MRRWIASELRLFPHSKRAAAHHHFHRAGVAHAVPPPATELPDRENAREEKAPPCRLRREKASCTQTQPKWLYLRCPSESRGLANPRLGGTRATLRGHTAVYRAARR